MDVLLPILVGVLVTGVGAALVAFGRFLGRRGMKLWSLPTAFEAFVVTEQAAHAELAVEVAEVKARLFRHLDEENDMATKVREIHKALID